LKPDDAVNHEGEEEEMKKRWIGTALVSAILAVSVFFGSRAGAGEPSKVRVRTNFDNAYVHVSQPGERHLEIEVTAPDGGGYVVERRPPLNVALVIDKSGSMAQAGKMDYVKRAARETIDRLGYGDRFSVVSYDDDVRVLIPSEPLEDRHGARRAIDRLFPGGSTNLGAGLVEGFKQVRRHFDPEGINRVILLSDGLANRGVTSARKLSKIVNRESRRGISLTTFGVGRDFNEDLLASMAESGRGTYYYIDRPHRIGEMLAREFSLIEQVVALDVTITIEVRPEVVISDIMGYEYHREGNHYRVRLGDMAAGERRRIMVRLEAPSYGAGEHRIGEMSMRYQPQGSKSIVHSSSELRLQYVRRQAVVKKNMDREVAERSAVFDANAARREAAKRVDEGDLDGARAVLGKAKEKLMNAPVQSGAVKDEISRTDDYSSALDEPMAPTEMEEVQKGVKYRSYKVLQSK
jgi:Ca-activated chloride channel family protein